ncbi:MAG TPA: NADH-quinone oxidoreductase subunit NuoE [candidate division Zixibacteria bacterium]|nr:NADH-quinone oxidoreductase subunit NuoE [candidate division Zixibacteria bacterium]MDD4917024.1 NADH-quinone oxidoreductase subunit NuoE [candidate division Zixibacteria bacterium]MDM7971432.1 NADH-quinone oxidoreductase subunit NuoE [candidate division Zixibacteria bacterium]HOD66641.1 NADH-quinone oxidoreductase subunit NuoE [candidate division Zixibacteria bacterium]HOZ07217.1 NADH-quinone oxidoreductase subunit NuoE [candidate division Zixibacteria bacterium]
MILSDESVRKIKEKVPLYPRRKSSVLPALTIAYQQLGYVDDDIYREIARVIGVPYVEVAEAASFYTMFPKAPRGKYLIQVCHNLSCALLGADSLIAYLEKSLGIRKGETTPDKLFTLISVECLGSCATAPMMQINNDFYENLTPAKVDQILNDLRSQA